jgi:hypothetical protein
MSDLQTVVWEIRIQPQARRRKRLAAWNHRTAPVVTDEMAFNIWRDYERMIAMGSVDKIIAMKAAVRAALETPDAPE